LRPLERVPLVERLMLEPIIDFVDIIYMSSKLVHV